MRKAKTREYTIELNEAEIKRGHNENMFTYITDLELYNVRIKIQFHSIG